MKEKPPPVQVAVGGGSMASRVHISRCASWYNKTPPLQVAGDAHYKCKWGLCANWWQEKHHQRKLQRVKTITQHVPAQYREEIDRQLEEMLQLGIITESNSPWMAPAVYVRKKSGELRMCVDHRELDKRTSKYAYLPPLPDEV